jgi:DNA (cytosine-5)-methyltransferase 1
MKKKRLKAIDFFSGAGGLTYGLRMAGIDVVAGIDNDNICKETYEKNNPGSTFLERDVTKYAPEELERDLKLKKNDDTLLFAGCAPCQYWSIIHTTKEKSEKTKDLIFDFQKYVEYFLPGFILVENVPGISSKKGSPMASFLETIEKLGYTFKDHHIVDMSKYGIPQKRRRFTLLASRVADVSLPKTTRKEKSVKDVLGERNGFQKISAGTKDSSKKIHTAAGLSKINLERLKMTPPDGGDRTEWQKKKNYALACFSSNSNKFSDTYGRMWWNRPSPTITTKFYSISNGRFAHPEENRGISLREGATLQTFPKNYEFVSSSTADIAKMIGNAVPPDFAKILGEQIVKSVDN